MDFMSERVRKYLLRKDFQVQEIPDSWHLLAPSDALKKYTSRKNNRNIIKLEALFIIDYSSSNHYETPREGSKIN